MYRTEFKYIEKRTTIEPQPNRTFIKCFAIFKIVGHSWKPGETPSNSQLRLTFLDIDKNDEKIDEISTNRSRSGTAPELEIS